VWQSSRYEDGGAFSRRLEELDVESSRVSDLGFEVCPVSSRNLHMLGRIFAPVECRHVSKILDTVMHRNIQFHFLSLRGARHGCGRELCEGLCGNFESWIALTSTSRTVTPPMIATIETRRSRNQICGRNERLMGSRESGMSSRRMAVWAKNA
jgi:hypothetical protein